MTPGEAAFKKWNSLIPTSNRLWWKWESLPESAREGWEKVALEAVTYYRCQCECHEVCGN